MRYLLLLIVSFNTYAMSFGQAQVIYQHLVKANGFKLYPGLRLNRAEGVNASTDWFFIEITQGMLRLTKNEHELAVVLGHELAHFSRKDPSSTPSREFAADLLGAQYADKAGYDHCIGAYILYRFKVPADGTHPDSTERYNRIRCY